MNSRLNTQQVEKATSSVSTNPDLFNSLLNKTANLAVVGLGYVGLPVALEFARQFSVIGFDISENRVDMMKRGEDPSDELESWQFKHKDIKYTWDQEVLAEAQFYIVAVPTPIDCYNQPDLTALRAATSTIAKGLKKGDYVVFESTVYPGCTEEVCVPILEKVSGLKFNVDFKVGYSPERINPGDKVNTIDKIVKIVSGSDEAALRTIAEVYTTIIKAGIHRAPTIKVAEAAKIVENTQRDVNIALMNELSMIFEKLDVNTFDVLEAAGTKWNFLKFYPGLVGGHCISVDPYYLIQKAIRLGHNPILISASRSVNDSMPVKITQKIAQELKARGKKPSQSKVLVMGITFKEDVTDIRNSKAADVVRHLSNVCGTVVVNDPLACPIETKNLYGLELSENYSEKFDAIVVAVSHKEYYKLEEADYRKMMTPDAFIMDIKGVMKGRIEETDYFSL
ncbi:MAG: UDP-N-acetyl-D-galactosamine dehydrogenase [Polaribacter sp.]|jgi:UDP-N-acetyl-D-galactosamine dehydrogenase